MTWTRFPPFVVTMKEFPSAGGEGLKAVRQTIVVASSLCTGQSIPSMVTTEGEVNPVPVNVTVVPPELEPKAGLMLLMSDVSLSE